MSIDFQLFLQILGSIGSFLSGIGLIATAIMIYFLARQTRANEQAATAAVYQSIVSLGAAIDEMLMKDPTLCTDIFCSTENAEIFSTDGNISNSKLYYAATRWLDYFETILVLWKSIPPNLHAPWQSYIEDHFARSPYLRDMVLKTTWYGDDLKQYARKYS